MPPETTSFPIRIELDVAWGEQDALGHVNNVIYFKYFESARIAHFGAIGMTLPPPGSPGCGPILASTSCEFLKPLTYPDHVRVEAGVSRLGKSSFIHNYRVYSQRLQAYVAQGQSVSVYYDYATAKSTPIPETLRAAILGLEAEDEQ